MFEDSMMESAGTVRTDRARATMISFAVQMLAVAALLTIPLLHPAMISPRSFPLELAPPVPPPPPPTPHIRVTEPAASNTATMATPASGIERIARPAVAPSEAPPAPGNLNFNLTGTGDASSPLSLGTYGPGSPVVSVTTGPAHSGGEGTTRTPQAISTGVSAGLLLTPIRPVYPPIARAAHQSGVVDVEAVISTTGRVESAHATSGPMMLQGAAVDAVRNARYRPFLLNGKPTEVSASFSIHFTMD